MIRDILPFPERYWLILNLMGAAHLKKNLGWRQQKIDKLSETKEKQLEEHFTAN